MGNAEDLISRSAALKSLGEPPHKWPDNEYEIGLQVQWASDFNAIKSVPPAHQDHIADADKKVDLISRQAAIDIERNATVDTNPSHFEAHQKFTQFMDDAEVSSFGRWQWSNGFNTALTAVGIDLKKLPSTQPRLNKKRISDLLWNEYRTMSPHLSAEGVVARRYYCKELWKELFGEEETPVWMTW